MKSKAEGKVLGDVDGQSAYRLTFLGTGTSHGIPMIGCHCAVCTSDDPRDTRTRCSLLVELGVGNIVIDTTPEFRLQCLARKVGRIDAVLFTHTHADHIFGLDDIRRYCRMQGQTIPCYSSARYCDSLRGIFAYAFNRVNQNYSERPKLTAIPIDGAFTVLGKTIVPLTLLHGDDEILGYRMDRWAYCTDCSAIPEATYRQLEGLDVLVLDALRYTPHPTHFNVEQAIEVADRIGAKATYFTHIAHEILHSELEQRLPEGMFLAYDGLSVAVKT